MTFPDEQLIVSQIIRASVDPCIVDLGARAGEDTEWMLAAANKQPRIVMVEADKGNFEKLIAKNLPGTAIYGAIADHEGTCDFWENHDFEWGFGSIYEPLPGQNSVDYSLFRKTENIPCFTFDSLFRAQNLDHIDMLWVDIHGAEKDMISHGQEALRHTRYLFVEFFEQPSYRGMATRTQLLAMLPGWTVVRQFPWNLLLRNDTR